MEQTECKPVPFVTDSGYPGASNRSLEGLEETPTVP